LIALPHLHDRMDTEVRRAIERQFARDYPDLKIAIRSAEVVEGEGISVRGVSVTEPGIQGPGAELLYYEEVFVQCSTDLKDLLAGPPEFKRVMIRRPTFRVTRRPDETWSCQKLFPLPKREGTPPEVIIEDGKVEIFDPLKTPASTFTFRDLNLTVQPPEVLENGETGSRIQGTLAGDHLRRVGFEGLIRPADQGWTIGGVVDGLDIAPELQDSLPGLLADKIAPLGELRGHTSLTFKVDCDPASSVPYRFDISGNLERARMDDPRLPHALTDMHAKIHVNNEGISVEGLIARCGQATIEVSARHAGFSKKGPTTVAAEIRKLELDRQLLDILPPKLQDQWRKYYPAGCIDATAKLTYDGVRWKPEAYVRCLDVSFTHHKFPYRLEQGTGEIRLKDDYLEAHLTAYSGSQPIRIDCTSSNITTGPIGVCELRGDEMPIDEKLFQAIIKEKPQAFLRSLHPRGTVGFYTRLERRVPRGRIHKDLVLGLNGCSIRYEKFPYPLDDIRGTVEMHDDHWTLKGLHGTNDTGRVTCNGQMTPPAEGRELFLRFVAEEVPLDEELRDALKPNVQQLWNDIRPRGTIDLVADVRHKHGEKKVDVTLRAQPRGENTSINPVRFPYRLEKLRGELEYRDGYVTLRRFRGEHGAVRMSSDGYCDFPPNGTWHFHLENLSVDRLKLDDRELVTALPERLRKGITALKATGPVNIRGSFDLEGGPGPGQPLRSKWNVALNFQQAGIDCGLKLENLSGGITLDGKFDGTRFQSRGELAIDSLTYKDLQFTQVIGPLWMNDQQVLFGSWVDRRQGNATGRQPRPITATLFGGKAYGDAWVMLGQTPTYAMQASLAEADLARCAREVMPGRQELTGKMNAKLEVQGSGKTCNTIQGSGAVALRDADIYELPLMISLLKILSIREPDQTAFTSSDIDFRIAGEHLYFDRINFNGDAISLLGKGEMDFNRNVGLNFYTMVGSGKWEIPVIGDILGGASQQTLQVSVNGNLSDPKITKEVLPGLTKAIQQIDRELQEGSAPRRTLPEARRPRPNTERTFNR